MKVSYKKELATHLGPESCLDVPRGRREALTGENVGVVVSSEISTLGSGPCPAKGKATTMAPQYGEVLSFLTESRTHGMHGSFLRGNRETRQAPSPLANGGGWLQ